MIDIREILRRLHLGEPDRRIARDLSISRNTVAHYRLWAARHGRPMLNGQGSAFVPLDTLRLNRYVQNHWIKHTPADVDASKPGVFLVQRFPVRYVVLPAARMRQLAPLAEALRSSRVFVLVGEGEDGSLVYEVRRENAPAAAPVADDPEDD